MLKWFQSYLFDCKQFVSFNGESSELLVNNCGFRTWPLIIFDIWLNVNHLSLNIDKTNFIIFHPFNMPSEQHVTININKKALNEKECIKYLSVIIDSSLSWKHHISSLTKKMFRAIGIMDKLIPFLPLL